MRVSLVLLLVCAVGALVAVQAVHSDVEALRDDFVLAEEVSSLSEAMAESSRVEAGTPFVLTALQLQTATGCSSADAATYVSAINRATAAHNINTAKRVAYFLAQLSHESGRLGRTVERLNYRWDQLIAVFGSKKFPTQAKAKQYAGQQEKIANFVYNGVNGNTAPADGWKYRGRGFIQLTGKGNYRAFSNAVGQDFVANPDLIAQPDWAALSSAWFWANNGLNALADAATTTAHTDNIGRIINRGPNSKSTALPVNYKERREGTIKAIAALGAGPAPRVSSGQPAKKTPAKAPAKKTPAKKTTKKKFF